MVVKINKEELDEMWDNDKKYNGYAFFLSHERIQEIKKTKGFTKIKSQILDIEKKMEIDFYFSCVNEVCKMKDGIFFHFLYKRDEVGTNDENIFALLRYIFNTFRDGNEKIFKGKKITTIQALKEGKKEKKRVGYSGVSGEGITCPLTF